MPATSDESLFTTGALASVISLGAKPVTGLQLSLFPFIYREIGLEDRPI